MKNNALIIGGIVVLALIAGAVVVFTDTTKPVPSGRYDSFATCLQDAGAKFYGAFWCPHCQAQKALFGDSVNLLPYVECSTPDGEGRTQICIEKEIEQYPTWEFADGSRMSGEIPLAQLAEKTSCELPAE